MSGLATLAAHADFLCQGCFQCDEAFCTPSVITDFAIAAIFITNLRGARITIPCSQIGNPVGDDWYNSGSLAFAPGSHSLSPPYETVGNIAWIEWKLFVYR